MKTRKKITAMFLAMMMALSIMAMPASALEDAIQPRIPAPECPYCNHMMTHTGTTGSGNNRYFIYTCQNTECSHFGYRTSILYLGP